jgi:tRNA-specific 2-thiouridylase
VTTQGEVVGAHEGIEQFTIGQRKGIGVAMGEPYFVVRIEAEQGRVVIGKKEELGVSELTTSRCNWIATPTAMDPNSVEFSALVQIRYNSDAQPATVSLIPATPPSAKEISSESSSIDRDARFRVHFETPCLGVAPGQLAVVYQQDRVLGGGWID